MFSHFFQNIIALSLKKILNNYGICNGSVSAAASSFIEDSFPNFFFSLVYRGYQLSIIPIQILPTFILFSFVVS